MTVEFICTYYIIFSENYKAFSSRLANPQFAIINGTISDYTLATPFYSLKILHSNRRHLSHHP